MSRSLGISFSSDNIYFTELVNDSGVIKADHIESAKVDFNFEDDLGRHKSSQKDLTNISSEIGTYIARRNLNISSASLSIGTSQAFLITLPIEYPEGKKSINSKIYWELSNYFPDNYNDFVINTYRLNNVLPCKYSDEFLIIAVHKNAMEFIKRVFKICGLELSIVDIDHFSAEHTMRNNYRTEIEGKKILLAGMKKGRLDFGIIENNKYKHYAFSKYYHDTEFNLCLSRKLSSIIDREAFAGGIDAIYLYGDEIKEDTLVTIRRLYTTPVEVINPFESISAADLLLKNENLRKYSYKYTASCGAALRNFTAKKE